MYHNHYTSQGNTVEEHCPIFRATTVGEWIPGFKKCFHRTVDVAETKNFKGQVFSAYLIINDNVHLALAIKC
jgi:hypothetical protein